MKDWLLKNIIPDYITEELRETQRYSRNLKNVGVIFASISNFYDFYEEQFEVRSGSLTRADAVAYALSSHQRS